MTFNEKEAFIMDNVIIEAYQVCLSFFDEQILISVVKQKVLKKVFVIF